MSLRGRGKARRAAHLKRNTQGTSNELSFSVLDGLKDQMDAEDPPSGEPEEPGRIGVFTLSGRPSGDHAAGAGLGLHAARGPGASAAGDAAQEIARRKARRRRQTRVARVLAVAVIVGVAAVLGSYGWSTYQQNSQGMQKLNYALELIDQADETLADVDVAVGDPFGESAVFLRATIWGELDDAKDAAGQALSMAQSAADDLIIATDKEAAAQAQVAASNREEALRLAESLLTTADRAQEALDHLEQAWSCMLEAADLTSEAAALVADTTDENVRASMEANEQAQEQLDEAREEVGLAEEAFDLDLSVYLAYIDKRSESLDQALASDQALLDDDKDAASEHNAAYNDADEEAAELATLLPDDPETFMGEAYEEAASEALEKYEAVSDRASTADAFIRDSLGV